LNANEWQRTRAHMTGLRDSSQASGSIDLVRDGLSSYPGDQSNLTRRAS
jgi:hypothetical protein